MEPRERSRDTERRRATILFADITGFTALNERLDPEEVYSIVADCLKLLDGIARRHGANVDKYLGDAIMAVFGVPFAIEDAPKAAINAAIEMHNRVREFNRERGVEPPLDIHSGIHTGLVISGDVSGPLLREFAVMGDAVNIAARLEGLAPNGRIWVGAETHRYTREEFEFRHVDRLKLKGKEERIAVYEVISRKEKLHRPSRRGITTQFVGRGEELTRLRRCVGELSEGRGGIVSVVGEAGLGKSRLVAELRASDEAQRTTWLQGRALAIGSNLSFHPFADLLRAWVGISDEHGEEEASARLEARIADLFGDTPHDLLPFVATLMGLRPAESYRRRLEGMSGEAREKFLIWAMGECLRRLAAHEPLVLVFEDLHWADLSSLELLGSLLRLTADHPILFVLVFRPAPPALERVIRASRALPSPLREEIRLEPLDRESAEDLLDLLFDRGDLPRALRSLIELRGGGNPFFLEEIVRSLLDEGAVELRDGALWTTARSESLVIPATVQEVVMSRIDRFPLRARQVLQVAAIVGTSCDHRILEAVADSDELDADLVTLIDGQLLVQSNRRGDTVYEFKHPLIQEVTYQAISRERRRELHRQVAGAIEETLTGTSPGYYGMLAYHFGLGHDEERAEEYLFLAGDEAARLGASNEALRFFEEASKLYLSMHGEGGDPRKKATLEQNIGQAHQNRGHFGESIQHYNRALVLLGQRVPNNRFELGGRFAWTMLSVLTRLYRPELQQRRPSPTPTDRAVIELYLKRAEAEPTGSPARFVLDSMLGLRKLQSVDPTGVPHAGAIYAGAATVFALGGVSFAISRRFLEVARRLVRPEQVPDLLLYRVLNFVHHFLAGDWSDEHAVDDELLEEGLRHGLLYEVTVGLDFETQRRLARGEFAPARECIERIGKIAELYQYDFAKAAHMAHTGGLRLEERELEEAARAARAYYSEFEEDMFQLVALGTKATAEALMGQLERAEETLEKAARIVAGSRIMAPFHRSHYLRARLALDVAQLERAHEAGDGSAQRLWARRARRTLHRAVRVSAKVAAKRPEIFRLAGSAHWLAGRRGAALRWWRRSLAAGEALGARPDVARTLTEAGLRLAARGRGGELDGRSADACLEQARKHCEALGLRWDLERLEAQTAQAP
ncbi:MAG: adenylate/guanylate cyclase domain-containing protein [Myxococcota bacterium]